MRTYFFIIVDVNFELEWGDGTHIEHINKILDRVIFGKWRILPLVRFVVGLQIIVSQSRSRESINTFFLKGGIESRQRFIFLQKVDLRVV